MPAKSAELNAKKMEVVKQAQTLMSEGTPESRVKAADLITQAEALGKEADDWVRLEKMEAAADKTTGIIAPNASMPHTDRRNLKHHFNGYHEYSLNRAIMQMAEQHRVTGLEAEVSSELAKRAGRQPKGILVPYDLPADPNMETRNLSTTTGSGAMFVSVSETVIEKLRAVAIIYQLGTTVLTDMVGEFRIPRQSALAQTSWVGAGQNVNTANLAIQDQVVFTPTTIGSYMDIDRRFIMNTALDAEAWTRGELVSGLVLGLDHTAFDGSGANNQPLGILNNPACIQTPFGSGGAGGAPSFPLLVSMETALGNANALEPGGKFAYVTNHKVKGQLKTLPKYVVVGSQSYYSPKMIWESNEVNDYAAFATTNIPNDYAFGGTEDGNLSGIIFGNWKNLYLALYSGMDILVDPYTGGLAGTIRVIIMQDAQMKLRQDVSFACAHDVVAA